eukprot:6182906-Amphidinium_carterae.1
MGCGASLGGPAYAAGEHKWSGPTAAATTEVGLQYHHKHYNFRVLSVPTGILVESATIQFSFFGKSVQYDRNCSLRCFGKDGRGQTGGESSYRNVYSPAYTLHDS